MRIYPAAVLLCLAVSISPARGDTLVLPPPTFVADSAYLGFPVGPVVGLALAAAAVTTFLWLRKLSLRRWTAALLCVPAYLLLNFGVYLMAVHRGVIQPAGPSRRLQIHPPTAPAAAPAAPTTK